MVWYWYSYSENGASSWKDFDYYRAISRVAWRDRAKAEYAANAFERRTGRIAQVRQEDGRKWRGKIR